MGWCVLPFKAENCLTATFRCKDQDFSNHRDNVETAELFFFVLGDCADMLHLIISHYGLSVEQNGNRHDLLPFSSSVISNNKVEQMATETITLP